MQKDSLLWRWGQGPIRLPLVTALLYHSQCQVPHRDPDQREIQTSQRPKGKDRLESGAHKAVSVLATEGGTLIPDFLGIQ